MRCPSRKVTVSLGLAVAVVASSAVRSAGATPPPAQLFAWGTNAQGQVGNNNATSPVTAPVNSILPAGRFAVGIGGGGLHSLAALDDGTVLAWGGNTAGQLGIGSTDAAAHRLPVAVPGLTGVTAVAAGNAHSLALQAAAGAASSSVWAWGNGDVGQLGDGVQGGGHVQTSPVQVLGLADVRAISAGHNHNLALLNDGSVWAWGDGALGELGDGISGAGHVATLPQPVLLANGTPLSDVVAIAAGQHHSLAVTSQGAVWAWGDNSQGQLGFLPVQPQPFPTPTQVSSGLPAGGFLDDVVAVAAGASHSLALKSDGTVWAWGRGTSGQLGDGTTTTSTAQPRMVSGFVGGMAVAAGAEHSLAIRADGTVWGWGRNSLGQLGTGDTVQRLGPAIARNVQFASLIAAGSDHSLAATYSPVVTSDVEVSPTTQGCGTENTATVSLKGYDLVNSGVAEMMLVLDESGSIDATEFNLVKQFAVNFVNSQNIGPANVRIGIVMFSGSARQFIGLNTSKAAIVSAINSISPRGGGTCIGCGIQLADTLMVNQGRPNVPRTIILMTDGANNVNVTGLPTILTTAKKRNTIVSIGVGNGIDVDEIKAIASAPSLAFLTPDFTSLVNVVDDLLGVLHNPGVSGVHLSLILNSSFVPVSASGGGVVSGQQVDWRLATLGSTPVPLTLRFRHQGGGGTLPLIASAVFSDNQGHSVIVPNPDVEVHGCADQISLSPLTATNFLDEPHTVVATVADAFSTPVAGVRVSFSVTSGPDQGTTSPSPVATNAQGEAPFTYQNTGGAGTDVIQASLTDPPHLVSAPAEKVWRPRNQAPIAHATAPPTVALVGSRFATVTLDGTASIDPDGGPQPLSYAWSEGGAISLGTTPTLTVSGLTLGTHTFRLMVSDGELSDDDEVSVVVFDPTPPLIVPSVTGTLGNEGWYVSDVGVSFAVADSESDFTASGCSPLVVSADTPGLDVTCSAVSAGGASSSTVSVKRDATAPVVTPPADQEVDPTELAGAVVSWPSPEVVESGSGLAASGCVPASGSVFPVGTTTVTCRATDRAGNVGSATFSVIVHPGPDGRIFGAGDIESGRVHHHFLFRVAQSNDHRYGRLEYWFKDGHDCGKEDHDYDGDHDGEHDREYGRDHGRLNRFEATSIVAAVFSNDPAFEPGGGRREPSIDSVRFAGKGKWNGRPGYSFEAYATDQGEPGRHRDTFSIVVTDASGIVVASIAGKLDEGNIQSTRLVR